jgi:hypothetical protein
MHGLGARGSVESTPPWNPLLSSFMNPCCLYSIPTIICYPRTSEPIFSLICLLSTSSLLSHIRNIYEKIFYYDCEQNLSRNIDDFTHFEHRKKTVLVSRLCISVWMYASLEPKHLDGIYSYWVLKSLSIKVGARLIWPFQFQNMGSSKYKRAILWVYYETVYDHFMKLMKTYDSLRR